LEGFNASMLKTLLSIPLSTSDNVPLETQKLWEESTTGLPRLFAAAESWNVEPPTSTQLILSTLDLFESSKASGAPPSYTAYRRGEADPKADPRIAIAQFCEPNRANPMAVIGLDILPESSFAAPLSLSEFVEPYDEKNQQLLLIPQFSHTDLHIDSADGVSAPMSQCTKIWVIFPPTSHNFKLLSSAEGQKAKLTRIGRKLEGGMIFKTSSAESIYLPVGCLHSVFTLHGGFLASVDFITPISCHAFSSLLTHGLDQVGSPSFQREVFTRFLSSVDLALQNKKETIAVSSWINALERVREFSDENGEWKKEATKIWDEYFLTASAKKMRCSCGEQGSDESFKNHLKKMHLWASSPKSSSLEPVENGMRTRSKNKKETKKSGKRKAGEIEGEEKEARRSKRTKR
jgi:hypothetical protein